VILYLQQYCFNCVTAILLFNFFCSAICTVLYEIRLGGFSDQRSPLITKFIYAVQGVFSSTLSVVFFPPAINNIFFRKAQKLHDDSWSTIFATSRTLFNVAIHVFNRTRFSSSVCVIQIVLLYRRILMIAVGIDSIFY